MPRNMQSLICQIQDSGYIQLCFAVNIELFVVKQWCSRSKAMTEDNTFYKRIKKRGVKEIWGDSLRGSRLQDYSPDHINHSFLVIFVSAGITIWQSNFNEISHSLEKLFPLS